MRSAAAGRLGAALAACCFLLAAAEENIHGMCYGPFPSKSRVFAAELIDDFMSEPAKPLWSQEGRGDLQTIRSLGANTVRTYGNDPQYNHRAFLDEANRVGLGVVPGLSDFPYTQAKDSCKLNHFDCYEAIKKTYLGILKGGFMQNGRYHPALRHMVVINEPDLKTLDAQGVDPKMFSKLIISAVDGVLDAEKEAGVKGHLVPLTATFSFAMCPKCPKDQVGQTHPALSQMVELRNAFLNPDYYGYKPKNDLRAVWDSRWMNSFNTQNPAVQLQTLFFVPYQAEFPDKLVTIEEFHSWQPPVDQALEVQTMMAMTRASPVLHGFQFFEFQVRYDKGENERHFGVFGLGDYKITDMYFFGHTYDVWCLKPETNPFDGAFLPEEYARGVGGTGVDMSTLCRPDASKVPLDQTGFDSVQGLHSFEAKKIFVERVASHMGFVVKDNSPALNTFTRDVFSFEALREALASESHSWARIDDDAACVADRRSNTVAIGIAIDVACQSTSFDCKNIPSECKGSIWDTGDYVFSTYYNLKKTEPDAGDALKICNLTGAARYAPLEYYKEYDTSCVVNTDPMRTPLTDEGYQAIMSLHDKLKMAEFITRVVKKSFGGARIGDRVSLMEFAGNPPTSMYDVKHLLKLALWVCGGTTNRVCRVTTHMGVWWWNYAFAGVGLAILMAAMCSWVWVHMEHRCLKFERSLTNFLHCKVCRHSPYEDDDDVSELSS